MQYRYIFQESFYPANESTDYQQIIKEFFFMQFFPTVTLVSELYVPDSRLQHNHRGYLL